MMGEHRTLEAQLTELAGHVDWPDSDVTARVHQRIVGVSRRRGNATRWRVAVTAVAAIAVVIAIPTGRQAVADLLGVIGIEVTFVNEPTPRSSGRLDLGIPVSLDTAADRVDFPLALPTLHALRTPDAVHLQVGPPSITHIVWGASPDLPAVAGTDIGLLLSQFKTTGEQPVFAKELTENTNVEMTAVGDHPALWIEGAPHQVTYRTTDGHERQDVSRLAANVLIWEVNGVTYRLESTLDLSTVQLIAETLSPLSP